MSNQTFDQAGWRLHLGTWPGYRYPTITLDLFAEAGVAVQESREPYILPTFAAADLAFRATVTSPPDDITDIIDVIIEGYTEVLEPFGWSVAANASPYGPWRVGLLAQTTGETVETGWLDWISCVLATGVDESATSWQITASPVDTTDAQDFPRDAFIGGERITVTACSGASAPQTWTVVRSVNGITKSHLTGERISLAAPFVLAL